MTWSREFFCLYAMNACLLFPGPQNLNMHFLVLLKRPAAGQSINSELGGNFEQVITQWYSMYVSSCRLFYNSHLKLIHTAQSTVKKHQKVPEEDPLNPPTEVRVKPQNQEVCFVKSLTQKNAVICSRCFYVPF